MENVVPTGAASSGNHQTHAMSSAHDRRLRRALTAPAPAMLVMALLSTGTAVADEATRAERSSALLKALFAGDGEQVVVHFNDSMAKAMPAATAATLAQQLDSQTGARKDTGPARHGCEGVHPVVLQRVNFERAELDAKIVFDADDRIAGLFFVPPGEAQPCRTQTGDEPGKTDDTDTTNEEPVTVGAEGWPLDGFLVRPDGDGPFPAVVLVHGSGPHDADETVFANKPFRDIAHGLVNHGVASLRYVKRTRAHGERLKTERPDFTIDDEVVDDAVAAVAWLRRQPGIDADRVFVVGHSLGATLAPRIGERSGTDAAGLVLIAAGARPIEDLVMEQVRHLAPSQGISDEVIAGLQAQSDRVKALARGEAIDLDEPMMLGLSAAYWQALSAYDPVASAQALSLPMLILHGERDYQVTMTDLGLWRDALGDADRVAIKSYPALNHLFIAGEGPSLPAEYNTAGHFDAQAIADMAQWIASQARPQP